MKHECPNCGCKFSEVVLSEKEVGPFCPVDPNGCTEEPMCPWPCKKLREQSMAPESS